MIRRTWLILAIVALAGLLVLAACGDDDDGSTPTPDPAQVAEVEDVATQMMETDPGDDAAVDFFLGHITAQGVKYFGYDTAEDCAANADDCIGEPSEVASVSDTEINGDEASTTLNTTDGDSVNIHYVREDDLWKLSGYAFTSDLPEGATVVDVKAIEYGYDWDPEDVGDGDVAFAFTNDGAEAHMMALSSVSEDFDIEAAKESIQDPEFQGDIPGVTADIGFGIATPGLTSNVVLEEPLAPGDYVLMCFIPNAEGTPHVVLNMYSEFTVE